MSRSINEIIRSYNSKEIKLTVKIDKELVYLEGSTKSLKFLAETLNAYADQNFQDDYWMSPKGPGNRYFSKDATHGIYFWNTDYDESKIKSKKKSKAVAKRSKPKSKSI